jgi:hypothetical protein
VHDRDLSAPREDRQPDRIGDDDRRREYQQHDDCEADAPEHFGHREYFIHGVLRVLDVRDVRQRSNQRGHGTDAPRIDDANAQGIR